MTWVRDLFLQNVQTGSEAHWA